MTCGRNAVVDDEFAYQSQTQRELEKKVAKGEKVKVFINRN